MGGFTIITDHLPTIPAELIYKWKTHNYHFTIEEIYTDLKTVFSDEQLQDLEANYVGFSLIKKYPSEVIPADFLNKTAAIIAINVNPYEYTSDLVAFANIAAICNDSPMMDINVGIVPSRYIPRALSAVQKITPKNYDFDSVFLHNNIQNYIFQCYYKDSFYLLDDRLVESYNMPFLNNSNLPTDTIRALLDFRPVTKDIREFIDGHTTEEVFDSEEQKKAIEGMFDELSKTDSMTEFMKDQFRKFTAAYMYDKYYGAIDKQLEKK